MRRVAIFSLLIVALMAALARFSMVGEAYAASGAVAPVRTVNHLQIRVKDPLRSYEFYMKLLGGHAIDTSGNGNAVTMMLGSSEQWVSFGKIRDGSDAQPGTLDHAGIGIDLPTNPEPVRQALKDAFPSANVRSPGKPGDKTYDRSIYLADPEGFSIQLVSMKDDGHLPTPDTKPAVPRTPAQGFVRFRSLNHLSIATTDRERSRDFYMKLLGATVRDQNGGQINLTLPGAQAWLSLLQSNPRSPVKAGNLHHLGVGIDYPSDIPGIDALRSKLKVAFPDSKVRSPGQPSPDLKNNYNRSIYVTDPDGVDLQLVTSTDDGWLNASAAGIQPD
jgi:catechol 2,3-dioxygenase-like lactoylglutathione lyase family enzyme